MGLNGFWNNPLDFDFANFGKFATYIYLLVCRTNLIDCSFLENLFQ